MGISIRSLLFILLFFFTSSTFAKTCGLFVSIKGNVQFSNASKKKWKKAKIGKKVCEGDQVKTMASSNAKLVMRDKNILSIKEDSLIELTKYEYQEGSKKNKSVLNVIYGSLRSHVKEKYNSEANYYQVRTKTAVVGVRGTDFFTNYDRKKSETEVITVSGVVAVGDLGPGGKIANPTMVRPGFSLKVGAGRKTSPQKLPQKQFNRMKKSAVSAEGVRGGQPKGPQPKGPGGGGAGIENKGPGGNMMGGPGGKRPGQGAGGPKKRPNFPPHKQPGALPPPPPPQ